MSPFSAFLLLGYLCSLCLLALLHLWLHRTGRLALVPAGLAVHFDIPDCPSCGGSHFRVPVVDQYIAMDGRLAHVGLCPRTGQRVILRYTLSGDVPFNMLPN